MKDAFIEAGLKAVKDQVRLDANETGTLERVLTQLLTTVHSDLYQPLIGRTLMPKDTEVAADADDYVYEVQSTVGAAKILGHATDDPPRIDVKSREVPGKVYRVGDSFDYSLDDLERAARTGRNLSTDKAKSAADAIERGIDEMLALGRTSAPGESNLVTTGLLNNADIAALTPMSFSSTWNSGTPDPDVMIDNLLELIDKVTSQTDGAKAATHMVLPLNRYLKAKRTKVGVDSDKTVLSWVQSNTTLTNISYWARANTQGANSVGRAVVLSQDTNVLRAVIPKEFTMLPPQARNYAFVVPCLAKCGGVKVILPAGCAYGDFQ